jgi:hypothetical protein
MPRTCSAQRSLSNGKTHAPPPDGENAPGRLSPPFRGSRFEVQGSMLDVRPLFLFSTFCFLLSLPDKSKEDEFAARALTVNFPHPESAPSIMCSRKAIPPSTISNSPEPLKPVRGSWKRPGGRTITITRRKNILCLKQPAPPRVKRSPGFLRLLLERGQARVGTPRRMRCYPFYQALTVRRMRSWVTFGAISIPDPG